MDATFDPRLSERLDAEEEIRIETRAREGAPVHRTIVWVVVDGGQAYVRSVRGRAGRWYRELTAHPQGAVEVRGERIPVRAVHVEAPEIIERVSEAYRRKYGHSPYLGAILRPEVLPTTLRLEPAGE